VSDEGAWPGAYVPVRASGELPSGMRPPELDHLRIFVVPSFEADAARPSEASGLGKYRWRATAITSCCDKSPLDRQIVWRRGTA
jgi:hypothetical protein